LKGEFVHHLQPGRRRLAMEFPRGRAATEEDVLLDEVGAC
jgi:hypothetical protein